MLIRMENGDLLRMPNERMGMIFFHSKGLISTMVSGKAIKTKRMLIAWTMRPMPSGSTNEI